MLNQFLWVIFPYLCLVVFVAGHIARYRYDKFLGRLNLVNQ